MRGPSSSVRRLDFGRPCVVLPKTPPLPTSTHAYTLIQISCCLYFCLGLDDTFKAADSHCVVLVVRVLML
ncbi:hypothetical protein E2C01_073293 [Portunus trituberculatus]|uniref:Uncharacterized protein n=1 Tax=Portunus trituberculatus TaxID=210409 RepID=A0A5B7I9F9_PORTR|nr:hypothetical protein [Portunus trituberculatus]